MSNQAQTIVFLRSSKPGNTIQVSIVLPSNRSISDFDLAAFHRWLVNSGYKGFTNLKS